MATIDWKVELAYAVRPLVKSAVEEAPTVPLKSPEVATNPWSVDEAYAVKPCPKSAVEDAWKTPGIVRFVTWRFEVERLVAKKFVEVPLVVVAFCAVKFWRVEELYAVRPLVKSAVEDAPSVPEKRPVVATSAWSVELPYAVKPCPKSAVDDAWRIPEKVAFVAASA